MSSGLSTLAHLCREAIIKNFPDQKQRTFLPLPSRELQRMTLRSYPTINLPLSLHKLHSWDPLFAPVPDNVRLHCSVDPLPLPGRDRHFALNLEHCGDVVPIMRATISFSKLTPFITDCFIKPASGVLFNAVDNFWTMKSEPSNTSCQNSSSTLAKRIVSRLRRSFSRGQLHDVGSTSPSSSPSHRCARSQDHSFLCDPPILAQTTINTLSNTSKFTRNVLQDLGSLRIQTNFFKNEPRHLLVTLPPLSEGEAGITLESKRPVWNPNTRVYELDFGGRINRDSVKNFQLKINNEVVSILYSGNIIYIYIQ